MAKKLKSLSTYVSALRERCRKKYGDEFADEYEDVIEVAARNKRMLDRFDGEIDDGDLSSLVIGSTGQQKEDVNPLIKYRNDVAKLYADNLDALFLTPRSKLKKTENLTNVEDKMVDYFDNISSMM